MNAKLRSALYIVTVISVIITGILTGLGLVDSSAIAKGVEAVTLLLSVVAPIVARLHLTPDEPTVDGGGEV